MIVVANGQDWKWKNPKPSGNQLNCVEFVTPTIAYAVGDYGTILKTTNAGVAWIPQVSGTSNRLIDVSFTDVNNVTIVSRSGIVLSTTNGGSTWNSQASGISGNLNGVSIVDANNIIAVGDHGKIFKTNDGGITWTLLTSGTNGNLFGVFFTDSNNGTVTGSGGGIILRTTDGGTNWTPQTSGTNNLLYDVFFTDVNNGTAVGSFGAILHTTNGGVTFVSEEQIYAAPTNFMLLQNFPNPFNPTTTIQYSIPQRSNVTLKVYDILGNEVATLINEERNLGSYEVQFSATGGASDLSSGIYFYKLQSGSFTSTKKMLLLK